MSRSYKKPYTKSKAADKSCRCNGGCVYCLANRMHKHEKKIQEDIEGALIVITDNKSDSE